MEVSVRQSDHEFLGHGDSRVAAGIDFTSHNYCRFRLLQHRPLEDWRSGITINTVVSVLSTIGQTAILLPVTSSISQLKWIWYAKDIETGHEDDRTGNRLSDMEDFDKASRGPIDCLLLVWKRPKW